MKRIQKAISCHFGVHLIGHSCSEMIWGAAALIAAEFRAQEIEEIVSPHPTVSELNRDSVFTTGHH